MLLLLRLLSHFSRIRLCVSPWWTVAHQAPPSLGFSRQEHWTGLPFPSPLHESESEVAQSCPTSNDPMDCSLPGSSIHGIFQARVLEWGAIAFSDNIVYILYTWYTVYILYCVNILYQSFLLFRSLSEMQYLCKSMDVFSHSSDIIWRMKDSRPWNWLRFILFIVVYFSYFSNN